MKKSIAAILAGSIFFAAVYLPAYGVDWDQDSINPFQPKATDRGGLDFFPLTPFVTAMHGDDVVEPEESIYFPIPKAYQDTEQYHLSVKTVEGAKYVKKISRVSEKDLNIYAFEAITRQQQVLTGRCDYMKVELKPEYTDVEHKVAFLFTLKAKPKSGHSGTVKGWTQDIFVGNQTVTTDAFAAGQKGKILKPERNEQNEIIWNDEIHDLAVLTFIADSDVKQSYPKLNTKWDNSVYQKDFAQQDAYLFDFVSNPFISATSRATLSLYDPFYNRNTDQSDVMWEEVIIYQVTENGYLDITDQFTYEQGENGDPVFTTKTRRLGTYIFAEQKIMPENKATDDAAYSGVKPIPDTGRN